MYFPRVPRICRERRGALGHYKSHSWFPSTARMPSSSAQAGVYNILIKRNFRGGLLRNGVGDADFCDCLDLRFFLFKNASGVDNI